MNKIHKNLVATEGFKVPDNIYFTKINLIDGGKSPSGSNAAFINGTAPSRYTSVSSKPKEEEKEEETPSENEGNTTPDTGDTTTPPETDGGGNTTTPPETNGGGSTEILLHLLRLMVVEILLHLLKLTVVEVQILMLVMQFRHRHQQNNNKKANYFIVSFFISIFNQGFAFGVNTTAII